MERYAPPVFPSCFLQLYRRVSLRPARIKFAAFCEAAFSPCRRVVYAPILLRLCYSSVYLSGWCYEFMHPNLFLFFPYLSLSLCSFSFTFTRRKSSIFRIRLHLCSIESTRRCLINFTHIKRVVRAFSEKCDRRPCGERQVSTTSFYEFKEGSQSWWCKMLKPVTSKVPCENLISRLNKNSCFDRGSHPVCDALRVLGNYFVGENKTAMTIGYREREREGEDRGSGRAEE